MSILIDADTTFIVQGITGREAVNLTRECLDYGTGAKVAGGVTPGRLVARYTACRCSTRSSRRSSSTARRSRARS
jgi:succinyl-CoA synthetase alpha subunit